MNAKSIVKSADRVLDVFEAFGEAKCPLSLSELAEQMGVPVSSCHGLVATLLGRGYLYSFGRRRTVYPTRRLFDVARVVTENDPVAEYLKTFMEKLRDATGETIILGKRQNNAVIYLEIVEGTQTIRYSANTGEYKPLHSSAIGKALMSHMGERALLEFVKNEGLAKITDNTIVDPKAFLAEIKTGRKAGYFVTRGENVADVMAVSMTLELTAGDPLGVAVAGPLHRMAQREAEIVDLLRQACLDFKQEGGCHE